VDLRKQANAASLGEWPRAVFLSLGYVARAHGLAPAPRDAPCQVSKILALLPVLRGG